MFTINWISTCEKQKLVDAIVPCVCSTSPIQEVCQKCKFNLTQPFYKFTIDNTCYNLGHEMKDFHRVHVSTYRTTSINRWTRFGPKRLFVAVGHWSTQCKRLLILWLAFLSFVNSYGCRIDSIGLRVGKSCLEKSCITIEKWKILIQLLKKHKHSKFPGESVFGNTL